MTVHARIQSFLVARDRAIARGDAGIIRATTCDLRRLGVPDAATATNPSGRAPGERKRPGRPKLTTV